MSGRFASACSGQSRSGPRPDESPAFRRESGQLRPRASTGKVRPQAQITKAVETLRKTKVSAPDCCTPSRALEELSSRNTKAPHLNPPTPSPYAINWATDACSNPVPVDEWNPPSAATSPQCESTTTAGPGAFPHN